MKSCKKCNSTKESTEFYKDEKCKDGLRGECKTCSLVHKKQKYTSNPDLYIARVKANYHKNPKSKIEKDNIYSKHRSKVDSIFRLKRTLRSRLCHAIKGNFKSGSAVDDLGCSIEEFKKYLESKFEPGMTWDNWSRKGGAHRPYNPFM